MFITDAVGRGAQRANNSQVPTGMRVRQETKWWRYAPYFGNTESVKWTRLGERASQAVYMHFWRCGASTWVKPHQIIHIGLHSWQSYTIREFIVFTTDIRNSKNNTKPDSVRWWTRHTGTILPRDRHIDVLENQNIYFDFVVWFGYVSYKF